jgi:hypothetical protein
MLNGNARVRHTKLRGTSIAESLSTLTNTCSAGAQCQAVQSSQAAKAALGVLQGAVTTAQGSLATKQSLVQAVLAAIKTLNLDFEAVRLALTSYEATVGAVAAGDASVIAKAGLLSQDGKTPSLALGKVPLVRSKVGKHPMEGIVSWPRGPGASSYALEANLTPQDPAGPWIDLGTGAGRRRVVKGPTPAAQILVRVASVASDGTRSAWSDTVLVTTL